MPEYRLSQEQVSRIEEILRSGKIVEIKMEHGKPVLIEIKRKAVKESEY